MNEFIAMENLKRFRHQLAKCSDERQRETLMELMAAEEEKLRDLDRSSGKSLAATRGMRTIAYMKLPGASGKAASDGVFNGKRSHLLSASSVARTSGGASGRPPSSATASFDHGSGI